MVLNVMLMLLYVISTLSYAAVAAICERHTQRSLWRSEEINFKALPTNLQE